MLELWTWQSVSTSCDPNQLARQMKAAVITDSKQVHDACRGEVLSVINSADKRGALEGAVLRQNLGCSGAELRWTHSLAQPPNGLTKSHYHAEHASFAKLGQGRVHATDVRFLTPTYPAYPGVRSGARARQSPPGGWGVTRSCDVCIRPAISQAPGPCARVWRTKS